MVKGLVVATGGASMYVRHVGPADEICDRAPVEFIVSEAEGSVTGVGGSQVVFTEDAKGISGSSLNVFMSRRREWHEKACEVVASCASRW
jgi:3'-phosphoadenosine 5'-phosphosulfate (PAPS) 3'-phosphatase